MVVLAKNETGYKNLVKLTSISHLEGTRGRGIFSRACIDKNLLEKHKEGLIVATACLGGEIPQAILRGRLDVAREIASWYKDVFGDDFYLEIQDHGSIEDRIVNVEIVKIAKELNIKLIATNFASCKSLSLFIVIPTTELKKPISRASGADDDADSYTHLTLPTIISV